MILNEDQIGGMTSEDAITNIVALLGVLGTIDAEELADAIWQELDAVQRDELEATFDTDDAEFAFTNLIRTLLE